MRRIDLVGQTYGQLKVVRKNGVRCGGQEWLCRCACGKEITVLGGNLRSGHTKSCGCLKANGKHSLTHGQTKTSLYNIASNVLGCSVATIKRRCDGRTSRGKHYPPFPNHYSIQKYPTENLCQ